MPFSKRISFHRKESQEDLLSARSKDGAKVATVEEDNAYAVFVTHIEVYNNYVYDLLDNLYENDAISKYVLKCLPI